MNKRIFCTAICALFLFPLFLFVTSHAQSTYLIDNANLLSQSEEQDLQNKLSELSETTGCDIVIITVNSIGNQTATEYADDYYDYNGYKNDGILLLVSMEYRDWAISTKGSAIDTFNDARQKNIMDDIRLSLGINAYYTAFSGFSEWCDYYLNYTGSGTATDSGIYFEWSWVLISLGIGVVTAFIVVSVMKGKLKTVHFQPAADSYVKQNSLVITRQNDFFLFRRISRTAIPKSSPSSNTHRSSSGSRHGGSSGKF